MALSSAWCPVPALSGCHPVFGGGVGVVSRSAAHLATSSSSLTAGQTRAYSVITTEATYTDIELAFAWLYQDAVKSDASTTGQIGVVERYRAAVGVFSHIALVALHTLRYVEGLHKHGKIKLPDATFSDPVVVTSTEVVDEGQVYEGDTGSDLSGLGLNDPLPQGFRPAFDAVHEAHQQRADEPEQEQKDDKPEPE